MYATLSTDKIKLSFTFNHDLVSWVKTLPDRSYNPTERCWYLPITSALGLLPKLAARGFYVEPRVYEAVKVATQATEELVALSDAVTGEFATPLQLYPFQRAVAKFMAKSGGCLNACDVQLGKTITTLAVLDTLEVRRALILAPKSVLYQWESEIKHWLPSANVYVVDGDKKARRAIYEATAGLPAYNLIMGYETMRSDREFYPAAWGAIVADEAQRLGNGQSQTYKALQKLQSRLRYALTATPVMNKVLDLWGIINWIKPGYLGSWMSFVNQYCYRDNFNHIVGTHDLDRLRERLKPIMIRKTLAEVAPELPAITYEDLPVKFSEAESKLYKQIKQELLFELEAPQVSKLSSPMVLQNMLTKMGKLAELSDSMELIGDSRQSAKLDLLKDHLTDTLQAGVKAIIFTRFSRMAEILNRELGQFNPAMITGSVTGENRQAEVDRFKADSTCQLFISTEAGGAGLSLQVAHIVYNYDLPWSIGKFRQRVGRVGGIRQAQPVLVYNLIVDKTIDAYVKKQLGGKLKLSQELLDVDVFNSFESIQEALV